MQINANFEKNMDGAVAISGTYERGSHSRPPLNGLMAMKAGSASSFDLDRRLSVAPKTTLVAFGGDGVTWFTQSE